MKLISMAMTPEEAKQEYPATMVGEDATKDLPKYPYGLTVCLCDESLKKLGIAGMPAVGTKMTLNAIVEVVGVSQDQRQGETESDMRLQITDMALAPAPEKTAAQGLYSASDMNP